MDTKLEDLSFELGILLGMIRLTFCPGKDGEQIAALGHKLPNCDPRVLLKLAAHHGLVSWLDGNQDVRLVSKEVLGADFLKQVDSLLHIQRFHYEHQTHRAVLISDCLRNAGVAHLVFKGSAIKHQVYPQFINSRMSDDLDLLIAPKSLSPTLSVLQGLGYSGGDQVDTAKVAQFVETHSQWYRGRDLSLGTDADLVHSVDLHWKLADDFSFHAVTEDLLANAVSLETRYGAIPTLPLHQHFVYLCSHGYSDYFFRLRSLIDIFLVMKHASFDKGMAEDLADYHGVSIHVSRAMNLASWFFSQNNDAIGLDTYGQHIVNRLAEFRGFTPRMHPNKGAWTNKDKRDHLVRQIKNRSSRAYWFSPIIARGKVTERELENWQPIKESIFKFYLKNLRQEISR